MIQLLSQLLPLLKKRDNLYILVIAGLGVWLFLANGKIKRLEIAMAQPPKIDEKIVTHTVVGPTRTVEKIIERPGGEKIVERIIYREKEELSANTERVIEPVQVQIRSNRYLIGGSLYPLEKDRPFAIHLGYSFSNRIDLLYGFKPVDSQHQLSTILRF